MPTFPTLTRNPSYSLDTSSAFPTDVVWYGEMDEQRLCRRSTPKRAWKLRYRHLIAADLATMRAFFATMRGKDTAFDWTNPDTAEAVSVHFSDDTLTFKQVTRRTWHLDNLTLEEA